jgi:hypothetical protein
VSEPRSLALIWAKKHTGGQLFEAYVSRGSRIAELLGERAMQDIVVKTLEGEKRYLEAQLKAVRECQQIHVPLAPEGNMGMWAEEVLAAAQEAGE